MLWRRRFNDRGDTLLWELFGKSELALMPRKILGYERFDIGRDREIRDGVGGGNGRKDEPAADDDPTTMSAKIDCPNDRCVQHCRARISIG